MSTTLTHFKLSGVDEFKKKAKRLTGNEMQAALDRIGRSVVIEGFNAAASHTPRRTGRLVQSMNMGATEGYCKVHATATSLEATYATCVPYAEYVENTVHQKAGQFVPGYWQGGRFVYSPGCGTGMTLKGATISGKHMFQKSLDDVRKVLPQIISAELERIF